MAFHWESGGRPFVASGEANFEGKNKLPRNSMIFRYHKAISQQEFILMAAREHFRKATFSNFSQGAVSSPTSLTVPVLRSRKEQERRKLTLGDNQIAQHNHKTMRDGTHLGAAEERVRKRTKMTHASARRLAKRNRMHSKRPRAIAKVSSRLVQECDLPYFLLDSTSAQNDLPPIPRMKRKAGEGPGVSNSQGVDPSYSSPSSPEAGVPSLLKVVSTQGIRATLDSNTSHLSDMPSTQACGTKTRTEITCHVARRPSRSKPFRNGAEDETWTPSMASQQRVAEKRGKESERPRRLKRCASEAFSASHEFEDTIEAEKEPTLPTRIQPKRGRGLPLCPQRVVKVYSILLARAGPDLKRSARIVAVEKRLHKGYSEIPSLPSAYSSIPKRPNRLEPFTTTARSPLNIRRHRPSWYVASKRKSAMR